MKETIIRFREFLLKHFKSQWMQTLIHGLISHEMISYLLFGIGTSLVDISVFTTLNAYHMNPLITNVISTFCAIIFAYITNRIWVFKSKSKGLKNILMEFFKFTYARLATLAMTEIILLIAQILYDNNRTANLVAKFIALGLTIIINYIFSKLFIFSNRKDKKNEKQKSKN